MFPVPLNAWATQFVNGAGPDGTRLPLASVSATIDDYTKAYVADCPSSANTTRYALVPKSLPAGGPYTVTVTIHATSQDGTSLPPVTQQFSLSAPAPPTQATQIQLGDPSLGSGSAPADPGSPTAVLTAF